MFGSPDVSVPSGTICYNLLVFYMYTTLRVRQSIFQTAVEKNYCRSNFWFASILPKVAEEEGLSD